MNALVSITQQEGQQVVDARELHSYLEVETRFADWIRRRIREYGFVEGVDFTSFLKIEKRETGGTTRKEYALTLTCAKELSMVEGNKKGKAARLYFIECERRAKAGDLLRRVEQLEAMVRLLTEKPLHPAAIQPAPEFDPARYQASPARQRLRRDERTGRYWVENLEL
ncbi:phage anti-repressor protein [Spirosoma lacussanchae]|uniref:antA/AntB antirepressor family protein n=1 Tax=Spirosoma lacussanchae TaxID=1884249 RepID=UPI001108304F|nr:antA/AntB antirepressor family protein [Spirosoma lacussanchae]